MRKSLPFIAIVCLLFFAQTVWSQTPAVKLKTNANDTLTVNEMISTGNGGIGEGVRTYKILGKDYAYRMSAVDSIPNYPGGEDKFKDTINYKAKAIYPEQRRAFKIEFIIDYGGKLIDFRLLSSGHPNIDRKLIKFIKSQPKWTPGIKDNKYVKVRYDFMCRPF
ncbi:energy transducer TonB [Mucilaginibacter sp. CAU 1740]|uniref:energy transducer TonB family protein n=1 Tax=Mucilaginibacter sp. CAU 1740 TaxID=3140365 RepID=UPI00325BA900